MQQYVHTKLPKTRIRDPSRAPITISKKNTFQTERLNRCEYCATARLAAVAYLYSGRTAVGRQTFLRRQLFKVSLSIGLLRAAKV